MVAVTPIGRIIIFQSNRKLKIFRLSDKRNVFTEVYQKKVVKRIQDDSRSKIKKKVKIWQIETKWSSQRPRATVINIYPH